MTSTPIMGTKINNIKKSIKKGTIIFFNMEVSNAENTNIIKKANTVKIRCFEKKK